MEELNLEVGKKVWSIQLGDCYVVETNNEEYGYIVEGENGGRYSFDKFGRYSNRHESPSLFISNPFERIVDSTKTIENKAELISALCSVIATNGTSLDCKVIAEEKLKPLLESL